MKLKTKFGWRFSIVLITLLIALTSQAQNSSLETVYPVQTDEYLTNPGIGWQNIVGLNNLLPETVVYPNRSDISWRVLNPSGNSYNWQVLDNMIEEADAQGKLFSFRIYSMRGEGFGGHQIPQWAVDADPSMLSGGEPNYANCTYQLIWTAFVEQIRQRYDGDPRIAFIDISGYGNFNEWSWQDQTEWDSNYMNPSSLDGQARVRLSDAFIGGSDNRHECEDSNGRTQRTSYNYVGFQNTQLIMPYAGVQQSLRYVAERREDVGIRFDCLGSPNISDPMNRVGDILSERWRTAPVVFEFCSDTNSESVSSVVRRVNDLLHASHGSMVHDNLREPRNRLPVEEIMRNVGYRYVVEQAVFDGETLAGNTMNVVMDWANVGTAPAYPSMGYDFALQIYLLDENGQAVITHNSTVDVSQWMPADDLPGTPPVNRVAEMLTLPENLDSGSYELRVALVEVNSGEAINIAIEGADDLNRYLIGTVEVNGEEPATPEPTEMPPTAIPTTVPPTPMPTTVPPTPMPTTVPPTALPTTAPPTAMPTTAPPDTGGGTEIHSVNWSTSWIRAGDTRIGVITITIEDDNGQGVDGVIFTSQWNNNTNVGCTTNSSGQCTFQIPGLRRLRN